MQREQTFDIELDRLFLAPNKSIVDNKFFTQADKDSQYRTSSFPLNKNRKFFGTHLLGEHNIGLTLEEGQDALERQKYFEENSYIQVKVEDTDYPRIALSELMPYRIIRAGDEFQVIPKSSGGQVFDGFPIGSIDKIIVDGDQKIEVKFIAASGLKTAVTGYLLPNSGIGDDDLGFYFSLRMLGVLDRPN